MPDAQISTCYNPSRVFQHKDQICPLKTYPSEPNIGTDIIVVPAETGKIIRIMGLIAQSRHASSASRFYIKQGVAGSGLPAISVRVYVPPYSGGLFYFMPIVECGYGEGVLSSAIYANVEAQDLQLCIYYISYAP
jgi:hypothetical protein